MTRTQAATLSAPTSRVSTFELFFDLVFVLTIVRVGTVLHSEPDLLGLFTVPESRQRGAETGRSAV